MATPEEEPQEYGVSKFDERTLWFARHIMLPTLLGLTAVTGIQSLSSAVGPRPYFADEPTEEHKKMFDSLPKNPAQEEFIALVQKAIGDKSPSQDAECPVDGYYIYQQDTDLTYISDQLVPGPNADQFIFLQTEEALENGWKPIATYTLTNADIEPMLGSDGNMDVTSAAYTQYSDSYDAAWDYMKTLGNCGYSRGNNYDTDTDTFGIATGPYVFGIDTFWINTNALT